MDNIGTAVNGFSPFNDPQVKKHQKITARASFKAFNSVAKIFLEQMTKLYPTDKILRTIKNKFDEMTADTSKLKVPSLAFFREIRNKTVNKKGEACEYVDLLVAHDEKAFEDPIPVSVLNGAGLSSKWKDMSEELRGGIWEYMDRLVRLSTQAVFSNSNSVGEMNELSRAVILAAASGKAQSPKDLVEDPRVHQAADKFVETIK